MASAAVTSKKTKSPTANKNYATNLAKGGSVTVKDGVKTYSDKALQVKGKGGISISGQSYSRDKGGTGFAPATSVITADKMKPVAPVPLAPPAPVDGLYGITNAANAGLAALNGGTYDTKTNQIVPPPVAPAAPVDNNQAILNSYLQANAGLEAPSAVSNLKEMQKTLLPKENLVNSLSGQLNTLNASRDAEMLKLEGQGRGQTSGFIGGEQARINREAAIQAMPIQAQLAIAQDDLDSARTYASQYFQAKMQDETNIYNQKKENNRLIFDYLNSAEQRRLDANEKALDREYAEKQSTARTAESIAMQAIEYGQSSLASKVMGLDPKSPTYAQDVRNAMAGLRKPVAAKDPKAPTIQNFGTSDNPMWKQYNYETGSWDTVEGAANPATTDPQKISESTSKLDNLLRYTKDAKSLSGSSGLGLYNRAANLLTGDSKYNRLANTIDTLKVNLLTMNTDPLIKKFFGPQMSNRDTELMTSAGTTLNAERQSTADMNTELNAYEDVIKRAKGWVMLGNGGTLTVQITDPTTGVKEYVPVNYETLSQAVNDGALIKF